jgi:hypothetical protein
MLLRQSISTGFGNTSAASSFSALHGARSFLPPLVVGSLGGRLHLHSSSVVAKDARAMADSAAGTFPRHSLRVVAEIWSALGLGLVVEFGCLTIENCRQEFVKSYRGSCVCKMENFQHMKSGCL